MHHHYRNILLIITQLITFSACDPGSTKLQPGILLTFDDRNMLSWENHIPLFAKYNAHVTFFIDRFDELNDEQIVALHKLKDAGHTIGCHGLRHIRAAEYTEHHSVEQYISEEILPAIKVMIDKGFYPSCFAYPNSNHNDDTDEALLKHFRYLRSGTGVQGEIIKTSNVFVKTSEISGGRRLDGLSFHPKSVTENLIVQFKAAMERLSSEEELLVLYAHDIRDPWEEGPKNFITTEALEEVLKYAYSKNIKYYSFDELP